jgi:glycosyltransferase involved in cell wall biosynthesis
MKLNGGRPDRLELNPRMAYAAAAPAGLPVSDRTQASSAGSRCELSGMKLCFVAGTLGQGGAERQLFYMMKALSPVCASLSVLCLTRGEFWERPIGELGVDVVWVGRHGSKALRLARIIRELRSQRPDLVQSQHFYTNIYSAAAARAVGVADVGAMRSDGVNEVKAIGPLFGRLSLRAPRVIAANSLPGARTAVALGVPEERVHFLPNVVDTDQFRPAARVNGADGAIRLIAAARLEPDKRIDRFLSVFAVLRKKTALAVRAVIAGDGSQRKDLESQAARLGLSRRDVEFTGPVSDMAEVYREGDVLVLTSDREGTPNVILEAMSCGLPVLATRVGGVPNIVQHGATGYVVAPGDEDAMTTALVTLVGDPDLRRRLGVAARNYVAANHSIEQLLCTLPRIYSAALS